MTLDRPLRPHLIIWALLFFGVYCPAAQCREIHVGLETGYFCLGRVYTEEPILSSNAFEFTPNSTAFSHGSVPSTAGDSFSPVSGAVYVSNIIDIETGLVQPSIRGKTIAVSYEALIQYWRRGGNPISIAGQASNAGAIGVLYTIPSLDLSFTLNNSIFNTVIRSSIPLVWITPPAYDRIKENALFDNFTVSILAPSSDKVFRYSREALYSLNAFTSLIVFWSIVLVASLVSVVTRLLLRFKRRDPTKDQLLLASAIILCVYSIYMIYALSDVFAGRGQLAYAVTGASHILFLSSGILSPIMLVTLWWASLWNDRDQFFVSQTNMSRIVAAVLCGTWCVSVIQHILETKLVYGPTLFIIMIVLYTMCGLLAIYIGIKFAQRLREASNLTKDVAFANDKRWERQLRQAIRRNGLVVAALAVCFVLVFPIVISGMTSKITIFFAFFLLHLLSLTLSFVLQIVLLPSLSSLRS